MLCRADQLLKGGDHAVWQRIVVPGRVGHLVRYSWESPPWLTQVKAGFGANLIPPFQRRAAGSLHDFFNAFSTPSVGHRLKHSGDQQDLIVGM